MNGDSIVLSFACFGANYAQGTGSNQSSSLCLVAGTATPIAAAGAAAVLVPDK